MIGNPIRVVRTDAGKYLKTFQEHRLAGVSFNVREDLSDVRSLAEMRRRYQTWNPDDAPDGPIARGVSPTHSVGMNAGCLWRFREEIRDGDVVISPDGYDWMVGVVEGDYYYRDGEAPEHCRPVRWIGHVAKAQLSPEAQQALTSWLAYFSVWPGGMGYDDIAKAVSAVLGSTTVPVVVPKPGREPGGAGGVEARVERLEHIVAALLGQAKTTGDLASSLIQSA